LDVTSFKKLAEEEKVILHSDGIVVTARREWIIEGEDRLSYTTLIRLIECCREYHWQKDILPLTSDKSVDSICKILTCNFANPISVGSLIFVKYQIISVRRRSYTIRFKVYDTKNDMLCANCDMVCVFYDPRLQKSTFPPDPIIRALSCMWQQLGESRDEH
jgi:acyl-CoA thioesterase FadM